MDNKKIMERINNLLSKTVENGCTPQEAASAAAMAQKLIAKHHVDMREFTESEEVGSDVDMCNKSWQVSLATTIAQNTCCEVVYSSVRGSRGTKRLTFIGRDTDRMVVLKLYDKLMMACIKGIREERARYKAIHGNTRGVEASYALGFIQAVRESMNEQCRALQLIVPESVEKKLHEMFPNCKSRSVKTRNIIASCYGNGHTAGRDAAGRKSIAM